jgi:transposase
MAFEVYMRQGSNNRSAPLHTTRRKAISAMWVAGMSSAEIGRVVGMTSKGVNREIFRMRATGWDLPYRNVRTSR